MRGALRRQWRRLLVWSRRTGLARKLTYSLLAAVIPTIAATLLVMMAGGAEGGPDFRAVVSLVALDVVLLLALGLVVGVRIVSVWNAHRRGASGSRLHLRLIVLFSLVALVPAILVSVGSTVFFRFGVESWFSDRVRTALQSSRQVAKSYLEEHQQIIGGDALAMANDINRLGASLSANPQAFSAFVSNQSAIRGLTEAIVFDSSGQTLARSGLAFSIQAELAEIPYWAMEKARSGEVAVLTSDDDDRVRALIRLQGYYNETFLYVGRFVDPKVIGYTVQTSAAVEEYERLEGRRLGLEQAFSLIFAVVSLLLLLAAVWVGLTLATSLATPIMRLIEAAERVRSGDLSARVQESGANEVSSLARAFNRMTGQLDEQRQELVSANRTLDERNRFTEAVLSGVSAGVIGLDRRGMLHLSNRSACELMHFSPEQASMGLPLAEVVPELADVLEEVRRRPDRMAQAEVKISRQGRNKTLQVRAVAEQLSGETIGYVVTADDITELVSAQRNAAWADVARRIAHEIKNPLTPIQLSAERLKRKYFKEIQSDPETYAKLIETIVRQVGDIGRMVDEFSSFARMPAPQMKTEDLGELCRQSVFLQRNGYPDVTFSLQAPVQAVPMICDRRLIGQALTNLLKNAVEAIQGRTGTDLPPGQVLVTLTTGEAQILLAVEDNGKGLPVENRERLTEPYMTTRAKGTGLGLAIVKKIVEDHGGELILADAPAGGALVRLVFQNGKDSAALSAV